MPHPDNLDAADAGDLFDDLNCELNRTHGALARARAMNARLDKRYRRLQRAHARLVQAVLERRLCDYGAGDVDDGPGDEIPPGRVEQLRGRRRTDLLVLADAARAELTDDDIDVLLSARIARRPPND